METQILKMDKPYNYIFCNGYIGLHIATMIVYETKTNEDGKYELETHSHPIVKYFNTPGGIVWNKAELTDCIELCDEETKKIELDSVLNLATIVNGIKAPNRSKTYSSISGISDVVSLLYDWGIEVEWPIEKYADEEKLQDEFRITLVFEKNSKDSQFKYSCLNYGSDVILVGGVNLPFYSEFNTKEDLLRQMADYMLIFYSLFNEHKFKIVFDSFDDHEFDDVIDEVNKMEPELREESEHPDL